MRIQGSNIQTAIASFHEAAMFPERWTRALDSISTLLHSDGATLLVVPTRAHLVAASTALKPFIQQHFSLPFPDPREQRVTPGVNEGFKADHAYFSPGEISREPYYQEFLVPRGFGWNAAAALGGGLLISLKRGGTRGPYKETDLAALDAALPQLRSVSRMASLAWHCNFSGQLDAFARIGRGAILLDEHARVLEFNSCVRFGDGLDVSGGCLQASRPTDGARLRRLVTDAISADPQATRTPTTLTVSRPSGLRPWLLDAMACTEALRSLHSRAAVLVLITDLDKPVSVTLARLSAVFGLTHTEAGLAREILGGATLQEAAARLDITEGHARQRLKAVFCKTGTSRQAELVLLLSRAW
jgi:DNA-binding CsgD family transcriptional regulator